MGPALLLCVIQGQTIQTLLCSQPSLLTLNAKQQSPTWTEEQLFFPEADSSSVKGQRTGLSSTFLSSLLPSHSFCLLLGM